MNIQSTLLKKHSFLSEIEFRLKTYTHIANRAMRDIFVPPLRFNQAKAINSSAIISVSETDLWNADDNAENWILTAGKVENLRVAIRSINGIQVPPGAVFSFWKQVGYPGKSRGFVTGREIREGCIVPTVAGGLCQLSNALYDAALKAGFDIIERHRHTRVIKGSLAELDRDATVKWNYIDLHFKAKQSFKIEAELSASKLIVKFISIAENTIARNDADTEPRQPSSILNDCYSCGNVACFKHHDRSQVKQQNAITAFILDEQWPEYQAYIEKVAGEDDFFITPLPKHNILRTKRYEWTVKNPKRNQPLTFYALRRAFLTKLFSKQGRNVFATSLSLDRSLAKAAAKRIPLTSTHVVIAQNLLPFVWESGALGGRSFDVLMTRLPLEHLHRRLDEGHAKYPESKTLNDFRADDELIRKENEALTKSRNVITPHAEIAVLFNNKSIKLNWVLPNVNPVKTATGIGKKILFPASPLARKGAYEIKQLAIELGLPLVVTGKTTEYPDFFKDIKIEMGCVEMKQDLALVVYPAYIENQPRMLLKAMAAGLPVITTNASGIEPSANVTVVQTGNFEELKEAVKQHLSTLNYR